MMDWASRRVLGWAVSNTMETDLCLKALKNAMGDTGRVSEIFNTPPPSRRGNCSVSASKPAFTTALAMLLDGIDMVGLSAAWGSSAAAGSVQ